MNKFFRKVFKFLFILLIGVLCCIAGLSLYIYHYQDKIIKKTFEVTTANLPYPIAVEKIQLSLWEHFPQLSLVFHQVVINDAKSKSIQLLAAQKVTCRFNFIEFLHHNYTLEHVSIADARITLIEKGVSTSALENKSKHTLHQQFFSSLLPFHLNKLELHRVTFLYTNAIAYKPSKINLSVQEMYAKIAYKQGLFFFKIEGHCLFNDFSYDTFSYKSKEPINVSANLTYNLNKQAVELHEGHIKQNDTHFSFQGNGKLSNYQPHIDIQIRAKKIPLSSLLTFLPKDSQVFLQPFAIKGETNWQIHFQKKEKLQIDAIFQVLSASFLPKGFKKCISIKEMEGKLNSADLLAGEGELMLQKSILTCSNSQLVGSGVFNFKTGQLTHQGSLLLDLPTLQNATLEASAMALGGQLIGEWQADNGPSPYKKATMQVRCLTKNVQLPLGKTHCNLVDDTQFIFKNGTLSFPNLEGTIEGKKFLLEGKIEHLFPFSDTLSPVCNIKLHAEAVALNELFLDDPPSSISKPWNILELCAGWQGRFICNIEQLSFKNFQAKKLRSTFQLQHKKMSIEELECRFAEGKAALTGSVIFHNDSLQLATQINLQHVALPALFTAFDNFNQEFLQARHLEGHISTLVRLDLQADQQLHIDPATICADVTVQLEEGALKDFEPLQKLIPYTAEKEFRLLKFLNLQNNLHIEHKTIFIPTVEIHTNLISMEISGMHSFDGKIDYHIVMPLEYADKGNINQLGGFNPSSLTGLNLYLQLVGNTEHYALRFDTDLLKANLQKNMQHQLEVLKKIFQGDIPKKPTKELSKDDYFDFD